MAGEHLHAGKACGLDGGSGLVKAVGQAGNVVGIGGDDHLAAHLLPLTQQPGARVEVLAVAAVNAAGVHFQQAVGVLCGIEWDILSEDKRTGYDYWIGSAHHLYGKNTGKYYEIDFRPQDLWDCINDDFDADPLAAVEAYFAEVEKVAALKPDILAHIDLIKKLNANGEFFDEESPRYKAAALKALQAAKANDCLLEVNTGSVYRGYRKDFYPGPWLLGEWQKMGGKVIITSDSHDINSLTFGFDEAAAAIKAAGFTSVQVLTGSGFETQEL